MVLDDGRLDLAQKVVRYTHEGERGYVPVVNLEDALVRIFRLVETTATRSVFVEHIVDDVSVPELPVCSSEVEEGGYP